MKVRNGRPQNAIAAMIMNTVKEMDLTSAIRAASAALDQLVSSLVDTSH